MPDLKHKYKVIKDSKMLATQLIDVILFAITFWMMICKVL